MEKKIVAAVISETLEAIKIKADNLKIDIKDKNGFTVVFSTTPDEFYKEYAEYAIYEATEYRCHQNIFAPHLYSLIITLAEEVVTPLTSEEEEELEIMEQEEEEFEEYLDSLNPYEMAILRTRGFLYE